MKAYPLVDDLLPPILRVAMPRAGRLYAPGGVVHVVARCNNRECCFTSSEDFERLVALLREMLRTYEVPLYAYTLRSPPGPSNRARGRRGHFWERRYRACVVEDDLYALAALRYLDRNPVRAGLLADPATYPWSHLRSKHFWVIPPVP